MVPARSASNVPKPRSGAPFYELNWGQIDSLLS